MREKQRQNIDMSPPMIDTQSDFAIPNHLSFSKAQLETENSMLRPPKTGIPGRRQMRQPFKGGNNSGYNWPAHDNSL